MSGLRVGDVTSSTAKARPHHLTSCTGCAFAVSQLAWQAQNLHPGCQQKAILQGLPGERAGSELFPGGYSVPCLLLSTLLFTLSKIWFFCAKRTDLPLGRDHLHSLTELLCMATLCRIGAKQTPSFFCHNLRVITSQPPHPLQRMPNTCVHAAARSTKVGLYLLPPHWSSGHCFTVSCGPGTVPH